MMTELVVLNCDMPRYKTDSKGLTWVTLFATMRELMYSEERNMVVIMVEVVVTYSVLTVAVETVVVVFECFLRKQVY